LTVVNPHEPASTDFVEQALLSSTENDGPGCRVVSAGKGLGEADLRELAAWGPDCDALVDDGLEGSSLNFHPLPSGAYCVSLTRPAGPTTSAGNGRPGLWTQCLIVPPEVLARFANDAFALARAARAAGAWQEVDSAGRRLERLRLPGGARPVDAALLCGLAARPGLDWMAALVQASLDWVSIGIHGGRRAEQVIAGLIQCFPPGCRTEFSFSTGLRFSPQRPQRIVAVSPDLDEQQRLEQLYNVCVLRLAEPPPIEFTPVDAWARLVLRVLRDGRTSLLERWFSLQEEILLHDLPACGLEFLEEVDADRPPCCAGGEADRPPGGAGGEAAVGEELPDALFRAGPTDLRSAPGAPQGSCLTPISASPPSRLIDPHDPQALHLLEKLDDLVFAAITGPPEVLAELQSFWPQVRAALDESLLIESREQYLRYVLSLWEGSTGPEGVCRPEQAVPSLDVLCLLFADN
jgi:hypothetical protein